MVFLHVQKRASPQKDSLHPASPMLHQGFTHASPSLEATSPYFRGLLSSRSSLTNATSQDRAPPEPDRVPGILFLAFLSPAPIRGMQLTSRTSPAFLAFAGKGLLRSLALRPRRNRIADVSPYHMVVVVQLCAAPLEHVQPKSAPLGHHRGSQRHFGVLLCMRLCLLWLLWW